MYNILICDDERDIVSALKIYLESDGYTTFTAFNGKEAVECIENNIFDIAGVRVICSFPSDIYKLAESLMAQDDIRVYKVKDYIANPKPNGYRSLHLIVSVPIFLAKEKRPMKVEIQLRTIAMDFWASLEHQLRYKNDVEATASLKYRLKRCAEQSAALDEEMQSIYQEINGSGYIEKSACVEADFRA